MQASETATEGSNATALPEVLGVLGQCLHRRLPGVDLRLQHHFVGLDVSMKESRCALSMMPAW
jgi:hypothetical protein